MRTVSSSHVTPSSRAVPSSSVIGLSPLRIVSPCVPKAGREKDGSLPASKP